MRVFLLLLVCAASAGTAPGDDIARYSRATTVFCIWGGRQPKKRVMPVWVRSRVVLSQGALAAVQRVRLMTDIAPNAALDRT